MIRGYGIGLNVSREEVSVAEKQSGRRPLKILLRIVCHFTSGRWKERRWRGEKKTVKKEGGEQKTVRGGPRKLNY